MRLNAVLMTHNVKTYPIQITQLQNACYNGSEVNNVSFLEVQI